MLSEVPLQTVKVVLSWDLEMLSAWSDMGVFQGH